MAGVDLLTLKELGGWKQLSMVQRYAHLRPDHLQAAVERLVRARRQVPELEEMAALNDPELSPLAEEELAALKAALPDLERGVALLLAPRDKDENASAILEVRAGTGGDAGCGPAWP